MIVNLTGDYFVEVDEMNHTLKKRGIIEKDGEQKETVRIIGYFSNMGYCLEKLLKIGALDLSDKEIVSLKEYSELIEKNCEIVMDLISEMSERSMTNGAT